jgi:uncharacterized protein YjbJ (UPF0337 family)
MSSNKDQTSTPQSYLDKATGAVQSAIGSLTGNTADKVSSLSISHQDRHTNPHQAEGENRKTAASAEHDLSHSAAKAGPFSVTPGGGVAKDNSDRTEGSWNQNIGAAKEAIGGLTGAEGLKQQGIQQNKQGKEQEAAGQVNDLGKGIGDRLGGAVGGAVAGLTGNAAQKAEAQKQHDEGKARQRGVEADLQKQVEAEKRS